MSPRGARNLSIVDETIDLTVQAPDLCKGRNSPVTGILMTCLEAASIDFSDLPSPPAAFCIAHLSQTKARCFSIKADPSDLRMTFTTCCFAPLQWLSLRLPFVFLTAVKTTACLW